LEADKQGEVGTRGIKRAHCRYCDIRDRFSERTEHNPEQQLELALLQVTLGPILEEVVFRGYLFSLLIWLLHRAAGEAVLNWLVIVTAAVIFALVHLAQPGVSWLQLACISMTGGLYGWIRTLSASTAPAAVAHAVYNLTLYGVAGMIEKISL